MMDTGFFSDHPPFPPPSSEDDHLAWLRLIRSHRVGVATFFRLIEEHGTAQAALAALPGIAKVAGVSDYTACSLDTARRELAAGRKLGAQLICYGTPAYPASLSDISDRPPVLWALGDVSLLTRPMVAMVGARNASSLGIRMAKKLADGLCEAGFVVVSGIARGIDAAAHQSALTRGTIGVQAGGIDVIYPLENKALHEQIAVEGLRLSEQPIGSEPQARHFPIRNRIVSGLSQAVVVVEAASRSGSLLTARDAADQGREVMAVPGHPFDARASGCNMLLRDGATLVRGVEDILEALAPRLDQALPRRVPRNPGLPHAAAPKPAPEPDTRSLAQTSALHGMILARLGPSPIAEDQLIRDLDLPAAHIAPELLNLELDGLILRQAGGLLSRLT